MSKVTVYVGLDYHKDSIQVCVMDAAGKVLVNRSCRNDAQAVVAARGDAGRPCPRRDRGLLRGGRPGRRIGRPPRLGPRPGAPRATSTA